MKHNWVSGYVTENMIIHSRICTVMLQYRQDW